MGLAGGPHCIAMCGAACASLSQSSTRRNTSPSPSVALFHLGRMLGYASLGALASSSVAGLAWMSEHSAVFKPLWIFFHVLVLVWGSMLVIYARQPIIADGVSLRIWSRIQSVASTRQGMLTVGGLWALMPCGLLYSALLVSSLTGNIVLGATSMVTFALGSSISLIIGPYLWQKLRSRSQNNDFNKTAGMFINEKLAIRVAGLLLCGLSIWAIWMDITHGSSLWCKS